MSDRGSLAQAVGKLRSIMATMDQREDVKPEIEAREEVLARFSPVFSPEHVPALEEAEVKDFLRFENNRHWSGLHRQGNRVCADMPKLREVLGLLVDETQPLAPRLDNAVDSIHGMGKAIVTAILLVAYPEKYGVWNNTSEAALRALDVWPDFERGMSFGHKYQRVNALLEGIASELGTDFWTLDALLWGVLMDDDELLLPDASKSVGRPQRFGLERHLQEFLRDNWDQTELGKEWILYSEQGDPEAGYEYPCNVGRIDLLARHRTRKDWLVIELKRDQTGDATLGQVLRYMGWVGTEMAQPGEAVKGLIIAQDVDSRLTYALKAVRNVTLQTYEVEFHLHQVKRANV